MRLLCALAAVSIVSSTSSAQTGDEYAEQIDFATLGVAYTGEVIGGVRGGVKRDAAYLHNIDLAGTLRFDARPGWFGPHVHASVLGNHGTENPSTFIGDAQTLSNIAAVPGWRVFELWIEQVFLDDRVAVLVGLYDLNSEFDVTDAGGLFINSSFGIGADFGTSGHNGPSCFPSTSVAGRIRWMPTPRVYVQFAALDGVPGDPERPRRNHVSLSADDGALLALEIGSHSASRTGASGTEHFHRLDFVTRRDDPAYDVKIGLGLWHYTSRFPRMEVMSTRDRRGSSGAYLVGERRVSRPAVCFARLGGADPRSNRFAASVMGGCVYDGLLPFRPGDAAGLAVSTAFNGTPYMDFLRDTGSPQTRAETAIEAAYALTLSPHVGIQADVQYIVNPGTSPDLQNALAATLRVHVAL